LLKDKILNKKYQIDEKKMRSLELNKADSGVNRKVDEIIKCNNLLVVNLNSFKNFLLEIEKEILIN
jgi:hypothetical protein